MSNLQYANGVQVLKWTGTASNGVGSFQIQGLNQGDVLIKIVQPGFIDGFESVVSNSNQLTQFSPSDWSNVELTFYFVRCSFEQT